MNGKKGMGTEQLIGLIMLVIIIAFAVYMLFFSKDKADDAGSLIDDLFADSDGDEVKNGPDDCDCGTPNVQQDFEEYDYPLCLASKYSKDKCPEEFDWIYSKRLDREGCFYSEKQCILYHKNQDEKKQT